VRSAHVLGHFSAKQAKRTPEKSSIPTKIQGKRSFSEKLSQKFDAVGLIEKHEPRN
jgi:hypothetical protein